MAVKKQIVAFLEDNGRSTTTEIARGIDSTTDKVRREAKDLHAEGTIDGTKNKRIPAYIIQGDFVVITGSREQLLAIVEEYAPDRLAAAKSMSTEALQKFIRNNLADQVVGGPKIWEFWV